MLEYDLRRGKGKLNHLLFIDDLKAIHKNTEAELDSLVHCVRIFTDDIKMEFELSKCATMVMRRGKLF